MTDRSDNPHGIHINRFDSQYDNRVKLAGVVSWDTLTQFFLDHLTVTTDKTAVPLFNLAEYQAVGDIVDHDLIVHDDNGNDCPRRKQANVLSIDALVLDYDGALSIEEAKERFQDYAYIAYTSHSHLQKGGVEKFRIVIQLASPIPADVSVNEHQVIRGKGDWHFIKEALRDFAGPVDPKSFETNTMYYLPSTHPDRVDGFQCWSNDGEPFDWYVLPRFEPVHPVVGDAAASKVKDSSLTLQPDDILDTKHGPIRIGNVDRRISGVLCPFHEDESASEFVNRSNRGNIYLYCKRCGTVYMEDTSEQKSDQSEPDPDAVKSALLDELLDFPTLYHDASDRSLVQEQLRVIGEAIRNNKNPYDKELSLSSNASHIVFMPEGAGKSLLARDMARFGQKIIFACKSWDQAFEKYDDFKRSGDEHGFSVDLFLSKDAKARRRFGVPVERGNTARPYEVGRILDDESLTKFKANNPNLSDQFIRVCWAFLQQDEFFVYDSSLEPGYSTNFVENHPLWDRFNQGLVGKDADILVTTHAQLRLLVQKNRHVPMDRIVWVDDPDITDVIDIEAYDSHRHGQIDWDNPPENTRVVNGNTYFARPEEQSIGLGQRNNICIYTTTEVLTRQAIENLLNRRHEEYVLHDKMNFLTGGRITILGTSKVQKRFDAIVPIISRLLEKQGFENVLIANGLGTPINHSNSKGNNQLKEATILVELSHPHPIEKFTYCDALEINRGQNASQVGQQMMLDRLHQAIGRNSGYRSAGYECVILADSHVHGFLIDNVRYAIDRKNSVQIDRTQNMSRNDRRTKENVTPFVAELESLINSVDQLVMDSRKIKPAIKHVVANIENPRST